LLWRTLLPHLCTNSRLHSTGSLHKALNWLQVCARLVRLSADKKHITRICTSRGKQLKLTSCFDLLGLLVRCLDAACTL
jgi:hypothetical protein